MRILFVSSTVTGGSGKSQRQLASRLVTAGHEVHLLVDDGSPHKVARKIYEKLTDLEVKVARSPIESVVASLASMMGRKGGHRKIDGLKMTTSYAPENAFPKVLKEHRPDVVVGSSIDRVSWRKISSHCGARRIPTVLYLREEAALGHLSVTKVQPDLLLANAESIATSARSLGYACDMVPSVVELNEVMTGSSREVALLINPIRSHGIDLCLELARRHPDIPFAIQESWLLSTEQRAEMADWLREIPNVEFRERTDKPAEIYRDARLLLVPHRIDNRPRVIAEAQINGIPVLASDEGGLIEAVGQGGRTMPADDVDQWSTHLVEIWLDDALQRELGAVACRHAARAELDPDWVTARFVDLLQPLIAGGSTP